MLLSSGILVDKGPVLFNAQRWVAHFEFEDFVLYHLSAEIGLELIASAVFARLPASSSYSLASPLGSS